MWPAFFFFFYFLFVLFEPVLYILLNLMSSHFFFNSRGFFTVTTKLHFCFSPNSYCRSDRGVRSRRSSASLARSLASACTAVSSPPAVFPSSHILWSCYPVVRFSSHPIYISFSLPRSLSLVRLAWRSIPSNPPVCFSAVLFWTLSHPSPPGSCFSPSLLVVNFKGMGMAAPLLATRERKDGRCNTFEVD